jgi:hypothetical protein
VGKGSKKGDMVQIFVHTYVNVKMRLLKLFREYGIKENDGGHKFNYGNVRTFVNISQYNTIIKNISSLLKE